MEHQQGNGSTSTASIEVASKGVSTKNELERVHIKKIETVIQLDESALSNSTATTDNNAPDTDSSKASAAEYYRLTSASRSKFLGKSPSKLEFQLIRKPSAVSKVSRKKSTLKAAGDFQARSEICVCRSNHETNVKEDAKRDPNASWSQKLKQIFDNRKEENKNPLNIGTDLHFEDAHEPVKGKNGKMITYNFEHGCPEYYKTFDCPPHLLSDVLAEQTVHHATRFWAEMFGFINIGVTFFVTFLLQLYRFILYAAFRTFIVGMLQITSDYFLKPLLSVMFNGFLQPPLVFVQNIFISCGNVLQPIATCIGNFLTPIGNLLRAVRLVDVNYQKMSPENDKLYGRNECLV